MGRVWGLLDTPARGSGETSEARGWSWGLGGEAAPERQGPAQESRGQGTVTEP